MVKWRQQYTKCNIQNYIVATTTTVCSPVTTNINSWYHSNSNLYSSSDPRTCHIKMRWICLPLHFNIYTAYTPCDTDELNKFNQPLTTYKDLNCVYPISARNKDLLACKHTFRLWLDKQLDVPAPMITTNLINVEVAEAKMTHGTAICYSS